ncbi:slr1814 [Synechocystis sp. PCC 6803]|uniref:Slr1814 protein n=1 Tax=Synechocystis sp. (strain ATCC 27184 / PCC 6803 / Kazusa) TaxID=1111708 RepID=P73699_SYNY3|nr:MULTISPECIES: DUF29 domain-containing protein [unclassified Synechocystis]BAM51497.1 hypothetical protein BEST7613_2566 [Synechocystis sp. PCC 6803] [Bacillus subtilis BEST7613]AGF51434.1 hypothetical protein MYO_111800 [Synechocystis sp. PCC 6803]ALJ67437.1 hypothetical protein AOY38_06050 [Synechocystis sp. PCC 6803]AVP89285.1 DUF29 domain-containing protein [Synechocystis sp. IPPAS B-1465]MBD2617509.1 DUF29 domain-containing protein [Synechocystis sp. FACHB-898]
MVAELHKTNTNLYETDYNLWVLETVAKLKNQDLDALDWENLIEEVEDLSRRDKHKLQSLLNHIFEHLLLIVYWQAEFIRNQGHWERKILNFRLQLLQVLEDNPSLRNYARDYLVEGYKKGRKLAAKHSQLPLSKFPEEPIATLEQVLDEDWLPQ